MEGVRPVSAAGAPRGHSRGSGGSGARPGGSWGHLSGSVSAQVCGRVPGGASIVALTGRLFVCAAASG